MNKSHASIPPSPEQEFDKYTTRSQLHRPSFNVLDVALRRMMLREISGIEKQLLLETNPSMQSRRWPGEC